MRPTEQEILAFLDSKYQPDIVLLGGSREQNREQVDSDWDLYLIGDYSVVERFPQDFRGTDLDIAVYPRHSLVHDVLTIYFGPLPRLRLLKDTPEADGAQIVQATQAAYEKGPTPLKPEERAGLGYMLTRLLAKAERRLHNPMAAQFVLAEFYREVIPAWFQIQNRWSLPIAQALAEIEIADSEFASLLEAWVGNCDVHKQCEIGHQLVRHLFDANSFSS